MTTLEIITLSLQATILVVNCFMLVDNIILRNKLDAIQRVLNGYSEYANTATNVIQKMHLDNTPTHLKPPPPPNPPTKKCCGKCQ